MTKKGFTLVELIVIIGILSIIMLIVTRPISTVIKYQKEAQISDNMRDNLQFVINKMEKELKTSSGVSSAAGVETLSFTNQNNQAVSYSLASNEIVRNGVKLTDSSIFTVTNLKFWQNTTTKLVTVRIIAQSLDGKDQTSIQTSVLPLNN